MNILFGFFGVAYLVYAYWFMSPLMQIAVSDATDNETSTKIVFLVVWFLSPITFPISIVLLWAADGNWKD